MFNIAGEFPELRELIKIGANILEKPFLPSELMRKVEDTLNPGRKQKQMPCV